MLEKETKDYTRSVLARPFNQLPMKKDLPRLAKVIQICDGDGLAVRRCLSLAHTAQRTTRGSHGVLYHRHYIPRGRLLARLCANDVGVRACDSRFATTQRSRHCRSNASLQEASHCASCC